MIHKIDLSTNGKIENYPKCVYTNIFKNKHWRELTLAYNAEDPKVFDRVLISCLNDVIDFEKTGFIKDAGKLKSNDIFKIYIFQFGNGKSESLDLLYPCNNENCEKNISVKVDVFEEIKENKLKIKLKDIKIKLNEEKNIGLKIPSRDDEEQYDKMVTEYKEGIIENIRKKEIDDIDKFLEENYLKKINDEIKTIHDIELNDWALNMSSLIMFIEDISFNNIKDFLDWIDNLDSNITKEILNNLEKIKFGFELSKKFECPLCDKKYEFDLPMIPRFFFQ